MPGRHHDIMAQALQGPMSEDLGRRSSSTTSAGAGGSIAMKDTANAAPDGYTVVFVNNGNVAVTPVMQKDLGYDGIRACADRWSVSPMLVVVNRRSAGQRPEGLHRLLEEEPGKLRSVTAGPARSVTCRPNCSCGPRAADGARAVQGPGADAERVLAGETKLPHHVAVFGGCNSRSPPASLQATGRRHGHRVVALSGHADCRVGSLSARPSRSRAAAPAGTLPEVIAKLNRR